MEGPVSQVLADKGDRIESVSPGTPVSEAVAQMNAHNIGALIVMDGTKLVGIFTERDVLTRIVAHQLDPQRTPIREVMTKKLVTIQPECSVREAMMIITDTRCRHLPVVTDGRVRGMISIGDLTRWMVRDQERQINDLTDYICRAG
jgi:CBS domain-containing protein